MNRWVRGDLSVCNGDNFGDLHWSYEVLPFENPHRDILVAYSEQNSMLHFSHILLWIGEKVFIFSAIKQTCLCNAIL